jgi:guanine deaminase
VKRGRQQRRADSASGWHSVEGGVRDRWVWRNGNWEDVRFQPYLNENALEIAEVARLFPWASDYRAVYERFGLGGRGAVMAHNVHPGDSELERLAGSGTSVSHCACSNGAVGSGIFRLRRHLKAGVHVRPGNGRRRRYRFRNAEGRSAGLYLATLASAQAIGLEDETGDFSIGKAADFVYLCPPADGPLAAVLEREQTPEGALAALFTLAGEESVREVRVAGSVVHAVGE